MTNCHIASFGRRTFHGAILIAFFALLVFGPTDLARAQARETIAVRAEGFAEGIGFAARKRAIEAAEQDAVNQYLETVIASEDLANLGQILASPAKYVDHSDVLRCEQEADTTQVEIDAHLIERRLQRDLADHFLPRLPAPPHVLLVIGEQLGMDNAPAVLPDGVGERTVKEILEKKGMHVSGVAAVESFYDHPELVQIVTGNIDQAAAFARGVPEDVVVLGVAAAKPYATAAGSNLIRNEAEITLRVLRSFDGKMVDELSIRHAVHAADVREGSVQAITDASKRIAEDISVAVVMSVLGTRMGEAIQLTVEQPGERARLDALISLLQSVPGVANLNEVFFSSHLARLSFEYQGPMAYLVDVLRGNKLDGAELKVIRVVAHEMRLAFS